MDLGLDLVCVWGLRPGSHPPPSDPPRGRRLWAGGVWVREGGDRVEFVERSPGERKTGGKQTLPLSGLAFAGPL